MANEIIPVQFIGGVSVANLDAKPKMFNGELSKNAEGSPVFVVELEIKTDRQKQIVSVEVPAAENPVSKMKLDQAVKLENLAFKSGSIGNGRWFKFTADSIKGA